jgi:hypothetical protein cdiviTM7_00597
MKKVNTRFKSFTMLAGLIFSSAFLFAQTFLNTTSVFADPTPNTSESTDNNQNTKNNTENNTENNANNNSQNTQTENNTENQGTGNQGNENTNSQTPPANQNGNTENSTEGNNSENHEPATCTSQIGAIGWLICPTTGLLAKGIDALYGLIQGLLDVKPLEMKGDSPIYQVWSYMRNIANICFIIFLLVIIYSQITGYGINNYGVKKSLPRLIVTAMVVNFSFLFCAIAVDISNILGNGLKDLLAGIAESAISSGTVDGSKTATGFYSLFNTVAAGGLGLALSFTFPGGPLGLLLALIPLIIGGIISVIVGLLVLGLRQALVIFLVSISPIAFVLYILPNTEKHFQKWKKTFSQMLFFYPMFSMLFGVSKLASMVLITSATTPFGLMVGAAVQVLPLLLAAGLMKLSGSALGGISNVLNSLGNNLSGRATKALSPIQEANRQKAIENAMKRQRALNLLPWYWGGALAAGAANYKFRKDDENKTREDTLNAYRQEELDAKRRGARILYRDKYGKAVYAERSLGVDKDGIEKKTQLVDPDNKVMRYTYQNRVAKLAASANHTKTEDALGNMGDYIADNKVKNKYLETLANNQTENFLEYKTAESSKRRNDHNANRFYSEVVRNAAKIDKNGNIVNKEDYEKYVVAGAGTDAWKVNDGTLSKEQESDRFIALQMVAADAVDAYESERRANVGKLSTYMDKMVTLDAFNLYKQMFKHKNIDGIIAGNNVLSRRGDYDKILKTVRTYMDDGNLKLGTDAANVLALNLMQMKDADPTIGRLGKFINMETWAYTSGKRQTQEVTIEQFFTGRIEDKFLTHISDQQQKDKERGYSTKINMATGLEGTSFAKVDRTAFDNVQDMIDYYDDIDPDMGQRIRKSILPAIISAMPTYQSGSEQRRNATKLVTGLDNDNYHNGKTIEENVPNVKKSKVAYDFSRDYLKSLTGADAAKLTTDMLDGLETRLMAQHYEFNPDNYAESERAAAQKEALAKAKQEAHDEINKIFTENTVIETLANKSGRLFDGMKSRLKDIVRPAVEEYRRTHASQTKNSGKNKN